LARAIDRREDVLDLDVIGAQFGQIGGRERATAQDVAKGVLCARAAVVALQFQVRCVMQQHGGDRQVEVPRLQVHAVAGDVLACEELGHACRGHQGVAQVVVSQVVPGVGRLTSSRP
jgi:hypothetical protein